MLYDTHCHPYLAQNKSQEKILQNFFQWKWKYLNTVSVDVLSSENNIILAKKYNWIFAVIWIHPTHVLEYKDILSNTIETLRNFYLNNTSQVVALWETGLDYYWLEKLSMQSGLSQDTIKNIQKEFFISHIRLAKELDLPIVIHNREAAWDVFEILKQENCKNFVFHCYSEDMNYARELIKFAPNCMLWFWWILTFKNAELTRIVAAWIPLKNIIIETDSPYLTPSPYRGKEENEPIFTQYALDVLCDIRQESYIDIEKQVFENSITLFKIKKESA